MDDTSKTIIEALGEQISFIKYQLRVSQDEAKRFRDELDVTITERDALKARLAAIPATLSRAEHDALVDMRDGVTDTPNNRRYDLEKTADGQV
jgi:hypothetical protein